MKCKCGCDKEVVSKGTKPKLFYSDACRKKYKRTLNKKRTEQTDTNGQKPKQLDSAPITQSKDEQGAGEGTILDAPEPTHVDKAILAAFDIKLKAQPIESATAQPATKQQLRNVGVKPETIDALDAFPSAFEEIEQPTHAEDVAKAVSNIVSLEHYHANPDSYIPRREPERLNWGEWMNRTQLEYAGLKANRVPIPGDWDYVGCVQGGTYEQNYNITAHTPPDAAQAAPVDEVEVEVK